MSSPIVGGFLAFRGNANAYYHNYGSPYVETDGIADCKGNLYFLRLGANAKLLEHDSSGTLIDSFPVYNAPLPNNDFTVLAAVGNKLYFVERTSNSLTDSLWCGTIVGHSVQCSFVSDAAIFQNMSDLSSYASFNTVGANVDTAYYCGGSGVLLYGTGTGPFTWSVLSGPATISGSGDSITVTCTGNARLLLLSSNWTGCGDSTDTVQVIYLPSFGATLSSNSPVCAGDSLQLTISNFQSSISYSWSGPNNFSGTGAQTAIANAVLADSGYYYVTANIYSCNATDSVWVTMKASPDTPQGSSNSPLCTGNSLQLTVNNVQAGVSYSWSGPNSFISAIYDPAISNVQLNDSGKYIVSALLNNCSAADTIHISIKPVPAMPTASSNSPVCAGNSLQLTVNNVQAGVTYSWNGPNGFNSSIYDPAIGSVPSGDSGKYRVYATLNGCSSKADTTDVIINPVTVPTVNISSSPATIVAGHTDTFTAQVNGCDSPTYEWYINGTLTSAGGSSYITSLVAGADIKVRVHCAGCADPDTAGSNVITAPLGVNSEERTVNSLRVWPNPVRESLHVSLLRQAQYDNEGEGTVRVSDAVGRLMYDKQILKGVTTIDTRGFASGVYFLEVIYSDGSRDVRKIIKE